MQILLPIPFERLRIPEASTTDLHKLMYGLSRQESWISDIVSCNPEFRKNRLNGCLSCIHINMNEECLLEEIGKREYWED